MFLSTEGATMNDVEGNTPSPVLEKIANIREQMNQLAADPAVLEMVCAGGYHPDLRMGDAIQALDELAFAMMEFAQRKRAPLPRPGSLPGVLISLKLHDNTRKQ
jgi:hypothetical protein